MCSSLIMHLQVAGAPSISSLAPLDLISSLLLGQRLATLDNTFPFHQGLSLGSYRTLFFLPCNIQLLYVVIYYFLNLPLGCKFCLIPFLASSTVQDSEHSLIKESLYSGLSFI